MALNMGNSALKEGSIPTRSLAGDSSFSSTDPRVSDVPAMGAGDALGDPPERPNPPAPGNPAPPARPTPNPASVPPMPPRR